MDDECLADTIIRFSREGRAWPTGEYISPHEPDEIAIQLDNEGETERPHPEFEPLSEEWRPDAISHDTLKADVLTELLLRGQDSDVDAQNRTLVISNVTIVGPRSSDRFQPCLRMRSAASKARLPTPRG